MAVPATPQSVADMDPDFQTRLKELEQQAAAEYQARSQGGQVLWYRPGGEFSSDVFDLSAMGEPFDRSQANQDYIAAVKDPDNPGVSGDLVAATTQIDYLAVLERAYRMRHTMRRPRAVAHMLGRKLGHGNDLGPIVKCGLEYVRGLLRQAKAKA